MVLNLKSTHARLIMAFIKQNLFSRGIFYDYFSLEIHHTDSSDLSVEIICSSKCKPGQCVLVLIHFNAQLSHNFFPKTVYLSPWQTYCFNLISLSLGSLKCERFLSASICRVLKQLPELARYFTCQLYFARMCFLFFSLIALILIVADLCQSFLHPFLRAFSVSTCTQIWFFF